MEGDPNKFTMESKKNLARKNLACKNSFGELNDLEILKNYGFQKIKTNISHWDETQQKHLRIFVYQHQTKDLIVYYREFDAETKYQKIYVITNNHYRKDGSWVEAFNLNSFKDYNTIVKSYKPTSISSLVKQIILS